MKWFQRILIPWRIRHRIDLFLENFLRHRSPPLYKLISFGKTNLNTPEYWDEVWSMDSVERDYKELFSTILERVPVGAEVLDVGCGVGNLAKLMRDKRSAKVTCLDFSSFACKQLAKEGFEVIVTTLPKIPVADNTFDVAVATEVLEHLGKPEKALCQMARVVRRGGLIMCSVSDNTLHPGEELEHQQSFTETRLRSMFSVFTDNTETVTGQMLERSDHKFLFACGAVRK